MRAVLNSVLHFNKNGNNIFACITCNELRQETRFVIYCYFDQKRMIGVFKYHVVCVYLGWSVSPYPFHWMTLIFKNRAWRLYDQRLHLLENTGNQVCCFRIR